MSKIARIPVSTVLHECEIGGILKKTKTDWYVGVWQITGGAIEVEVEVETIEFPVDDCGVVNGMSTVELMSILAVASVKEAIAQSYLQCPSDCQTPNTTTAWMPSCVSRTGSGTSTAFTTCSGSGTCRRHYTVCGNANSPTITPTGSTTDSCTGCSSTCP